MIRTERLEIRPVRPEDVEAVARLWSSPKVTQHLGGPRDKAGLRRALRTATLDERFDLWAVEERESGRVVGHCGLLARRLGGRDEVELIYVLGSRSWGRGLATEAAGAILDHAWSVGLTRVVALITPDNHGSIKVARKLGMAIEGDHVRSDGSIAFVFVREAP